MDKDKDAMSAELACHSSMRMRPTFHKQSSCEQKSPDLLEVSHSKEMACRTKVGQLLRSGSFSSSSFPNSTQENSNDAKVQSFKSARLLLRECSVVLIVLETLILLFGYCVLVGLHFSVRYGYRYVFGIKRNPNPYEQLHEDLENGPQPGNVVNAHPPPVPRRMARG